MSRSALIAIALSFLLGMASRGQAASLCALVSGYIAEVREQEDPSLQVMEDVLRDRSTAHADFLSLQRALNKLTRQIDDMDGRGEDSRLLNFELIRLRKLRAKLTENDTKDLRTPIEIPPGGINPFVHNPGHFHSISIPSDGVTVTLGGVRSREVRMTQSFQISDLITQGQWAQVFGRNPSAHTRSAVLKVGETAVDAHLPVENISWWSALVFANRLSEMEGREPVYDLSQVRFLSRGGGYLPLGPGAILAAAAEGELRAERGTENNLLIRKEANGYRLPRETEWEYVARGGHENPHFRSSNNPLGPEVPVEQQAWYNVNAQLPKRVATRLPNPLGIHDMLGNVHEWVEETYAGSPSVPRYFEGPSFIAVRRGGAYSTHFKWLDLSAGVGWQKNEGSGDTGFRLVKPAK